MATGHHPKRPLVCGLFCYVYFPFYGKIQSITCTYEEETLKILITGKTSRIGCAFADHMKERHPDEVETEAVSLRGEEWKQKDWSAYDAILHCAGVAKTDIAAPGSKEEQHYYAINRDLAIEAAKKAAEDGVSHFIYLSTMMVYGNSAPIGKTFTIDKDTVPKPASVYGKSKLAGEEGVSEALKNSTTLLTIIREPVVYGQHLGGEVQKLLQLSKKLPVFPRINSTKSYIYEGNLSECFYRILQNKTTGILCPADEEALTTTDLFVTMRRLQKKGCWTPGHLLGLLKLLSHVTGSVNAVYNDMKYTQELSAIKDLNYRAFTLEESLQRCFR